MPRWLLRRRWRRLDESAGGEGADSASRWSRHQDTEEIIFVFNLFIQHFHIKFIFVYIFREHCMEKYT